METETFSVSKLPESKGQDPEYKGPNSFATAFIIISILLLIAVGIAAYFTYLSFNVLDVCLTTESISCPVFYCPDILVNGNPGTYCQIDGVSTKQAFRYDEEGNLMCQVSSPETVKTVKEFLDPVK